MLNIVIYTVIISPPEAVITAPGETFLFTCITKDSTPEWWIDNTLVDNSNRDRLANELDVRFSDIYNSDSGIYSLSISGNASTEKNNGTMIFCRAVGYSYSQQNSAIVTLLVAGRCNHDFSKQISKTY